MMDDMTPTAFLRARVAEREASADQYHRIDCPRANLSAVAPPCTCGYPDQIRAECEAKRRLIENERAARAASGTAPIEEQARSIDGPAAAYWRGQGFAIRTLAAVWADHPDYREEWRP